MQVPSLDQENPLEEGMAAHTSILSWRIPWTEEPWATVHTYIQSTYSTYKEMDMTSDIASYTCPQGKLLYQSLGNR